MSQVFFDQLAPAPSRATGSTSTPPTRTRCSRRSRSASRAEAPDLVLVYGDTNSTLAGAHAAADASVPLAHVEAGLRSGDLSMPEERNRIETDRLAWLLFCPDDRSRTTLEDEGVLGRIYVVGDVMADATRLFAPIARAAFPVPHEPRSYVVATIHRQANVEQPRLGRIVEGLNRIDEHGRLPRPPANARADAGRRTRARRPRARRSSR